MMIGVAIGALMWLVIIGAACMVFDLGLGLLTTPFDVGLFLACFTAVGAAHAALILLRRRRRR